MDVTALLAAMLAVAIYPGLFFLLLATVLHHGLSGQSGGRRERGPVPLAALVPLVAAAAATAQLPLTGSPALRLPAGSAVTANAAAVVILLAMALATSAPHRLPVQLAGLAAAVILAIATAVRSLSLLTISLAGSGALTAARCAAAVLLFLAASAPPASASRGGSASRAALALASASLFLPAALGETAPWLMALAALGMVAVSGLAARLWRLPAPLVLAAGLLLTAAGGVLALVSGRA